MMVAQKCGLWFAVILTQYFVAHSIIIQLPDGQVEGNTAITRAQTTFHAFFAMRYAQPPVGDLRFQLPQPITPWNGVYNATTYKNICYQTDHDSPDESEDCLFINVFTPIDLTNASFEADLAVMVFIHGGGFLLGAGGVGPNFFIDEGVVLVAMNYRLGPFGFASTQDGVLPGNLGLKDQVQALKWVQKNIQYFGGDPKKVTIFGQSAGAASVSYQLLSPLSKGLFIGAIQESGSALDPWAYQPDQKAITQQTAALVQPNATFASSQDIFDVLKNASAAEIDKASFVIFNTYNVKQGFVYSPVLEDDSETAFITKRQYGLFESGEINNVPTIIGMNSEECLGDVERNFNLSYFDENHATLVPNDMHINDSTVLSTVGDLIWNFHAKGYNCTFSKDVSCGIRYQSMQFFDKGAIRQAQLQSKHSKSVWFYDLTYDGLMGNNIDLRLNPYVPGMGNVTHSEELNYLFSTWYSPEIPDNTDPEYFPESDWAVHQRMVALWTNFAKYQNPTPKIDELLQNITWVNVESDNFKYLDIGKDLVVKTEYPKNAMFEFWLDLFNKYAVGPLETW